MTVNDDEFIVLDTLEESIMGCPSGPMIPFGSRRACQCWPPDRDDGTDFTVSLGCSEMFCMPGRISDTVISPGNCSAGS